MPEFAPIVQLSSLNGKTGFRLDGAAAFDYSGSSAAPAGDVNGDGFADLIIGAEGTGSSSGSAYVVFGHASGFAPVIDLSSLNSGNGFRLDGVAANDICGRPVASAGDVNGDGFADLIVGALGADPNGFSSGSSYVVFGKPSGFAPVNHLSALDGANGFRLDGEARYDFSGVSVASAGDVNGDGFADIIIGAFDADHGRRASGSAYVVFGKAEGFSPVLALSSLDGVNGFRLDGLISEHVGRSVASAGDINRDGYDDIIVGADRADRNGDMSGTAYVVFGKAGGFAPSFLVTALDGANGFRLDGGAAFDGAGVSVASAGDVNGDGFADMIVGADGADPNGSGSGSSYVVFGKDSGFAPVIDLTALDGSNGFRLDGIAAQDGSGASVASAGDVNGDGFADLVIGAGLADPHGLSSGAAYVVFGKASGFAPAIDLSTLDGSNGFVIEGAAGGDFCGASVSSAGDVNGDGFADLLVGAYGADPHGPFSGSSYVVFGHRAFEAVLRDGTATANRINGGFGADTVRGFGGNDWLLGWEDNDIMAGGTGADRLNGGRGDDTLAGGAGNDVVFGGLGADLLTGGGGEDRFLFQAIGQSGPGVAARDTIGDFTSLDDRIDVAAIDAIAGDCDDAFTFIGAEAFTAEGQIRAVQVGAGTLLLFNTAGPGGADLAVLLENVAAAALTAGDFIL